MNTSDNAGDQHDGRADAPDHGGAAGAGHDPQGYGTPGSSGYRPDDTHYGQGGYAAAANPGATHYGDPGYAAPAGGYAAAANPGATHYGDPGYGDPGYAAPAGGYAAQGDLQPGQWGGAPTGQPAATTAGPRTGRTIGIAAVVALLVGSGATAATYALVNDDSSGSGSGSAVSVSTQAAPSEKVDGSVSAAAAAIGPSVVTINVSAGNAGGTGSGIVIKSDGGTGYILTNNHVVSLDSETQASTNQISVTLNDGSTEDATVVGTDPADDLAVIKVSASTLKAATFAKSSALTVGQAVVAVGAPLGLSNTVTSGIVSAIARPVTTGSQASASIFNAVQTDAAINPGNSGGPLVDLNGHVVGVNSAIAGTGSGSTASESGNIGIGFAIPSDEASRIASQLITTGKATHAILGINVSGAAQDNTGPTSGSGATVAAVQSGSPAEKAGIKKGDVITKIGDQRIDDSVGAIAATRSYAPGSTVDVTVVSGSDTKTRPVTLGSSTDS